MNIVKLHDNRITLINGDSAEVMKKIKADSIDLTVTSPPYDDLRTYNGYSFDFENIAKELFRVTKIGGTVVWVVGDATKNGSESGTSFRQALYFKEIGFNLHDTMIYLKQNYIPLTHNRYEQAFEYMFIFTKDRLKTFNPLMVESKTKGAKTNGRTFYQTNKQNTPTQAHTTNVVADYKQKSNVWELSTNAGTKGHPAQYPEQLAYDHIFSWSNENDVVFDPFLGSGTTAKMAIKLNRRFIGIELSEAYFNDIAIPRCNQAIAELNNVVQ